jgi:gas vesicle protein
MKISDLKDLNKDDILAALGLETKAGFSQKLLGTFGIFGAGLLVGAATALLLAPKSGTEIREDIGQRFRKIRMGNDSTVDETDAAEAAAAGLSSSRMREDEART